MSTSAHSSYVEDNDLRSRVSQLENMLSESINGNAKPETIFEERRRALEREWQTVQDLRDEIALLKSELEMGKLPSEPQERRRLYMRRMDALQGKVAALEAEGAVLRQNCKEVSDDRASPAVGVAKRGKTNAAAPLSGQRRRVRNAAARLARAASGAAPSAQPPSAAAGWPGSHAGPDCMQIRSARRAAMAHPRGPERRVSWTAAKEGPRRGAAAAGRAVCTRIAPSGGCGSGCPCWASSTQPCLRQGRASAAARTHQLPQPPRGAARACIRDRNAVEAGV